MAQNKSYKELMELQGQSGSGQQGTGTQSSNQMLELILGRNPFQYNAQTDPAAQAARKTAARSAKAVTRDTLGQHAAMTGGMPSTAAVSAAAQAGNQAMAQGADKVAELEQLAYQNYQTEGQNMYNAFAAMQASEGDAFNRQMQEQQWAQQQEQWQYQKEQDAQARAEAEYQKKLALAQLAAAYGDYSGLKELGIDTSNYSAGGYSSGGGGGYRGSGGGSGGGSGSGGGGNGQTGLTDADYNDLLLAQGTSSYESVWARLAAQHGEAALIAAGFKKPQKAPASGSGAPVRETIGQPGKPAITPN